MIISLLSIIQFCSLSIKAPAVICAAPPAGVSVGLKSPFRVGLI